MKPKLIISLELAGVLLLLRELVRVAGNLLMRINSRFRNFEIYELTERNEQIFPN